MHQDQRISNPDIRQELAFPGQLTNPKAVTYSSRLLPYIRASVDKSEALVVWCKHSAGIMVIRSGNHHGSAARKIFDEVGVSPDVAGEFMGGYIHPAGPKRAEIHTGSENFGYLDPSLVAAALKHAYPDFEFIPISPEAGNAGT